MNTQQRRIKTHPCPRSTFPVAVGILLFFLSPALHAAHPLLDRATRVEAAGRPAEARSTLLRLLHISKDPADRQAAEQQLTRLTWQLLCGPHAFPAVQIVEVQSGDSLEKIGKQHGCTVELLRKMNGKTSDMIRVGEKLRVFTGTFSLQVDKSDNDMLLRIDGQFFKRYRVATGRNNYTPVGTHTITQRLIHPQWTRPSDNKVIPFGDPENELGTHYLGWSAKSFAIHGTWEPESIGTQASSGCVRMLNEEVKEIFMFTPLGTKVTVVN